MIQQVKALPILNLFWIFSTENRISSLRPVIQGRDQQWAAAGLWALVSFPLTVILCLLCSITSFTLCISWSKGSSLLSIYFLLYYWIRVLHLFSWELIWIRNDLELGPIFIEDFQKFLFERFKDFWIQLLKELLIFCCWISSSWIQMIEKQALDCVFIKTTYDITLDSH